MPEFRFKVLCSSDNVCEEVKKNLTIEGFEDVKRSKSLTSDLEGIKTFKNEKEAVNKAKQFYNKYSNKVQEILTIEND